jgi:hypothetical protein
MTVGIDAIGDGLMRRFEKRLHSRFAPPWGLLFYLDSLTQAIDKACFAEEKMLGFPSLFLRFSFHFWL